MLKLCYNILFTYCILKNEENTYLNVIKVCSSCEIESREYNNVLRTKICILSLKRT